MWAASRTVLLGLMCMLNALFGFLQHLCDRPALVVHPTATLELKEERDVDTSSTTNNVNVTNQVRLQSTNEQVTERSYDIGPSRPSQAHHGGPRCPTHYDGIFADRLL